MMSKKPFSLVPLFALIAFSSPLPEQLPLNYLKESGMLTFQEPVSKVHSPLVTSLQVNGVPIDIRDRTKLMEVFSENMYAMIPLGTRIQKSPNQAGKEVWDYPVGTEVAHLISFNDVSHTIFEFRILRKIATNNWEFASYSPSTNKPSPSVLQRNRYTGFPVTNMNLRLANGSTSALALGRINLQSCQGCHFVTSIASYQYPDKASTGPCGFTPGNDAGIANWIKEYSAKYGTSPF